MKAKKGNDRKKRKSAPVKKTRKELRKDKRKQKKINRAQFYEQKKQVPGKFVLNPGNSEEEKPGKKSNINPEDRIQRKLENEKKQQQRLAKQMERNRKNQLQEDNEKEDRMIKKLEKQLKLNKRKGKGTPKSFVVDGLDYLLDFCNDEDRKLAVETEKQLLGATEVESDFEEDFAMMAGVEKGNKKLENDSENSEMSEASESQNGDEEEDLASDEENEDFDLMNDSEEEESEQDEPKPKKRFVETKNVVESKKSCKQQLKKKTTLSDESNDEEDMESDFDSDAEMGDIDGKNDSDDDLGNAEEAEDGTWEDIYGRKRDKDGNIITSIEVDKYVPPAARLKLLKESTVESEKLSRLRKQLKGLINRLAEHNMHTIANEIEELYMSNSRNDMNELLSKLMMESIVAPVITPDRLIAEHMMLIAILHANVGTEVGAHFLLSLIRKFDEMINNFQDVENKEMDNLVLMISHLYNFKVYGSQLVYQILDELSQKFTEKEIEIILLILKTVGFLLRKDDPIALKELILSLQQKAGTSDTKSANTRIRFLLDVLLAIKNNNMSKIPQYDPSHIEHLKKLLKTFLRKGNSVTQFNISLNDLLNVDQRGKWWIVGSAWTGNLENPKTSKTSDTSKTMYSQKILDLARKQRMNTDTRRNIFCILMTAEDYLDAFEKIHHLALKDQQAREVIHVLMDCCLQEKKFNPYYAVLAQKFCDYDRKNQMTLQYNLWDKLKDLDDYSNVQLHNLAKFLAHLFLEKGIPLSVLKIVQFGELDKPTMRLVRQIMLGILLHENTEVCLQVFERISVSPQLQTFREGLRLFISHFLVKNADSKPLPEDQVQKLKERADLVDKLLLSRASKTIF